MLVVEDSALIALDLECALQDLGVARVTLAPDPARAFAALGDGDVSAALVDVFLDREDGLAVARELKTLGIPFALMTGLGDARGLQAQFPGTPILPKPFSGLDLIDIVECLC
ncbi:MAG: response regulator [Sphingobium sp.]|nr:response regulator [Sphingobium sp.]